MVKLSYVDGNDGTNIGFVFEILNIQTFSTCSIRLENLQLYKRISFEYFPSCKIGPGWSFIFWLTYEKDYTRQTTPHIYVYIYIQICEDDATSQQNISTPFSILTDFEATEYSIRYSIGFQSFEDIRPILSKRIGYTEYVVHLLNFTGAIQLLGWCIVVVLVQVWRMLSYLVKIWVCIR